MTYSSLLGSASAEATQTSRSQSPARLAVRHLLRQRFALAGLVILGLLVLLAIFAPVVSPYDPEKLSPRTALRAPSAEHPFGTDTFGRDLLTRLLYGGRISLRVGLLAVA